ncbi:MAG: peroxiredoxin [Parvularculaceae bacterium]
MTPSPQPNTVPTARIDDIAPDFEARSTQGLVRMTDYRSKWLVFFSHPADFTPVCTTEFVAFQQAVDQFKSFGCELLGLSVDSLYAHLAWVKDIEERFDVRISFPIIEDISMAIARCYGMIHDNSATTAAVRSVFFIDPEGYIRAQIHYPMNVGRSIHEILRVLAALQQTDERQIATPEGWQQGDDFVLPPPLDQDEADRRSRAKGDIWYFTKEGAEK